MKIRNKTTGEVKEITPEEAPNYGVEAPVQKGSNESLGRYLEPQIIPAIQTLLNYPQAISEWGSELKQKGPFAAPDPKLRDLLGGTSTDTGNRFSNSLLDALKMTQTSTRAGAEVGTGVSAIKALLPYLTYNGVNQLKDKMANQSTDAFQGSDIQSSLTDKLTAGNQLGNDAEANQITVRNLLDNRFGTKQNPITFSVNDTYTPGDLNTLAKNIGTKEIDGYDPTKPAGMVRSAVTDIVKGSTPETSFPYKASNFLQKLGKTPVVGSLIKNPWTWPVAEQVATKTPGWIKSIFGI